jgi:hypothetical protein
MLPHGAVYAHPWTRSLPQFRARSEVFLAISTSTNLPVTAPFQRKRASRGGFQRRAHSPADLHSLDRSPTLGLPPRCRAPTHAGSSLSCLVLDLPVVLIGSCIDSLFCWMLCYLLFLVRLEMEMFSFL